MIRILSSQDKDIVLEFTYKWEIENLFIIGSFDVYKNTFEENDFWGYFEDNKLVGVAVFFKRFGNFLVHAQDTDVINELVDHAVLHGKIKLKSIVAFKKYADIIAARLEDEHNIIPRKREDSVTLELEQENFVDFSLGDEKVLRETFVDDLIRLRFDKEPTDDLRKRIFPEREFMLEIDNEIVSAAKLQGISDNYFQIGGVVTREDHRGKGYAKRVVSALCKHYFDKGIKTGFLFTGIDNKPALKIYKDIGFKKKDEFLIVRY